MAGIASEFAERLDGVIVWDKVAVENSTLIKKELESAGTTIEHNDILIAGHAVATDAVLVTDNVGEFSRANGLNYVNWVDRESHPSLDHKSDRERHT